MKTKIQILGLITVLSVGLVLALYLRSRSISNQNNGFVRSIKIGLLTQEKEIVINAGKLGIAGADYTGFYLWDRLEIGRILTFNIHKLDTQTRVIAFPDTSKNGFGRTDIQIAPPYFYVTNLKTNHIFYGTISDWQVKGLITYPSKANKVYMTKSTKVLARIVDRGLLNLGHWYPGQTAFAKSPAFDGIQGDGVFSRDGMFLYDQNNKRLVYLFHYFNQFLVMNDSLKLLAKEHTIDTVTKIKYKLGQLDKGELGMASPMAIVNRKSCLEGDWLYVNSGLRADNESVNDFELNSPIDVYNVKNGKYLFSFYLPKYKGDWVTNFTISKGKLLATYKQGIVLYRFSNHI
ncbi:hypothetical protein FFJ24_021405 [Pedobacter sp. KBS0701]|uniref:hypothetical protein n=1 Tax=Pedobacter sp. KBS0701 TaxID=2578106 RepID=UPI00110EFE9E|nr:hypothetical protein [Pedobacter sp. KBS0701]QDW27245.1 hypothetical protein FFJ24_021405 [Pedobacter sp. KBS0701]